MRSPCVRFVHPNRILASETSPYSAVLASLSLIFRQLLTDFHTDIDVFVRSLKVALGPQLPNVQLLFTAIPGEWSFALIGCINDLQVALF